MKTDTFVQCTFAKSNGDKKEITVGLIPYDSRIKPGVRVELKGLDGLWAVEEMSRQIPRLSIKHGWNNNI